MKKIFVLFLSLFLTLYGCASIPTPTRSENLLINSGNIETPASKKEVLQISEDLQQKIYELDKRETLPRIVSWTVFVSIFLNILGIVVAAGSHR